MASKVRLAFLWHMHQPLYREPETGEFLLPWVRLHATRAYYDMAWMLERHPAIRCTVNFTPVLMEQLEAYARGEGPLPRRVAQARPGPFPRGAAGDPPLLLHGRLGDRGEADAALLGAPAKARVRRPVPRSRPRREGLLPRRDRRPAGALQPVVVRLRRGGGRRRPEGAREEGPVLHRG